MLNLLRVAITGGIASGKSSCLGFFQECGAYCTNADAIVHRLLVPYSNIGQSVIALLGSDIVVDGILDRRRIAKRVFDSSDLLLKLESIIHPAVHKEILEEYIHAAASERFPLFVAEVPLLFEAEGRIDLWYDCIVVVRAPLEKRLNRISHTISRQVEQDVATDVLSDAPKTLSVDKARAFESADGVIDCPNCPRECEKCGLNHLQCKNPHTESMHIQKRIARQLSPEEQAKRATFIIENRGSLAELKAETLKLFDLLVTRSTP